MERFSLCENDLSGGVVSEWFENAKTPLRRLFGGGAAPLFPTSAAGRSHNPESMDTIHALRQNKKRRTRRLFRFGTLHQKRYFVFLCNRGRFLIHKPGVKKMTRGLFHFSGNLIE